MNRARIKGAAGAAEAALSQAVLLQALGSLTRAMAPLAPLTADYIFLSLRPLLAPAARAASVHLLPFPAAPPAARDAALEARVARMQAVPHPVLIGHAASLTRY